MTDLFKQKNALEEIVAHTEEQKAAKPKKKRGRPKKIDKRVDRSTRVPVSGNRDILTLKNEDPDFVYYWVLDNNEKGTRIMKFLNAGYIFVTDKEGLVIGEDMVYKSNNVGTVIRYPNPDGRFLYLMKQRRDWYEEDKANKMEQVDELEQSMAEPDVEGKYGSIKIGSKMEI